MQRLGLLGRAACALIPVLLLCGTAWADPAGDEKKDDKKAAPKTEAVKKDAPKKKDPAKKKGDSKDLVGDDEEEVEVTSRYPGEEREFGPIDLNYRGALELSFFSGWNMYSSELELETGGGLYGTLRFTINLGEESQWGLDLNATATRMNYKLREQIDGFEVNTRDEVTITTWMAGFTYRLTSLRFEYATPYIRLGLGICYFDTSESKGTADGTAQIIRIERAIGFAGALNVGFDYKMDKHWSLRVETGLEVWSVNWLDEKETHLVGSIFSLGVVLHM